MVAVRRIAPPDHRRALLRLLTRRTARQIPITIHPPPSPTNPFHGRDSPGPGSGAAGAGGRACPWQRRIAGGGGRRHSITFLRHLKTDRLGPRFFAQVHLGGREMPNGRSQSERISSGRHYENRLVALVDILGFRELVDESSRNPRVFDEIERFLTRKVPPRLPSRTEDPNLPHYDRHGESNNFRYVFSDDVVWSAPNDSEGLRSLIHDVLEYCSRLLFRGHLTRGGIVCGQIFHDRHVIFGPALVSAHVLEAQVALYPRILVSEEVVSMASETPLLPESPTATMGDSWFRRDFDGAYHLDLLRDPYPFSPILRNHTTADFFQSVHATLQSKLSGNLSQRNLSKWRWLAIYFSDVASRIHGLDLRRLPIPE